MPFLRTLKNLSAGFSFFKKHACQWEMPLVPEDVCVERNRAFHSIRVENHSHQQIGRSTATQTFPTATHHFPNGSAKVMSFLGKKKWSHRRSWQQTAVQIGCKQLILVKTKVSLLLRLPESELHADVAPNFPGKSPPQDLQHLLTESENGDDS